MTERCDLNTLSAHAPPRYTEYVLPRYRFVPGSDPHPTADPYGHSFNRSPPFPVEAMDGRRWRQSLGYLYGCDLYNRGYWWEAHEAWERIWHLAVRGSPERGVLQGLIQLANCQLKLHMGRTSAVFRLQQSYAAHFERVVELVDMPFLGLYLPDLRTRADDYVLGRAGGSHPVHQPAGYPFLELSPVHREQ